jgi:ketosteroid isomerase-like protein
MLQSFLATAVLASLLAAAPAIAQSGSAKATDAHAHPAPATAPAIDVPAEAEAPVAVVEQFGEALAAADFATVERLLDADVLILETGGAERSRAEYLGHHAIADAKFLADSHRALVRRRARVDGELAWVGTESELHVSSDGKPVTMLGTETVVLRHTPDGWRIVHIHWSSRPKKAK